MNPVPHALIPLESPPEPIIAGYATHGGTPRESYRYEGYWCLHLYHYRVRLELDGHPHTLAAGGMSVVPPGMRLTHHFDEPRCRHYYAVFQAPARGKRFPIPLLHPQPAGGQVIAEEFQLATSNMTRCSPLTRARLWSILWRLRNPEEKTAVEKASAGQEAFHEARRRIVENLASPLSVQSLARETGVSHNYLTRLFHRHAGGTVVAFIREQRLARAKTLLLQTALPIKRIAFECGIPDLHLFNKLIRTHLGASPRQLRAES